MGKMQGKVSNTIVYFVSRTRGITECINKTDIVQLKEKEKQTTTKNREKVNVV